MQAREALPRDQLFFFVVIDDFEIGIDQIITRPA